MNIDNYSVKTLKQIELELHKLANLYGKLVNVINDSDKEKVIKQIRHQVGKIKQYGI